MIITDYPNSMEKKKVLHKPNTCQGHLHILTINWCMEHFVSHFVCLINEENDYNAMQWFTFNVEANKQNKLIFRFLVNHHAKLIYSRSSRSC